MYKAGSAERSGQLIARIVISTLLERFGKLSHIIFKSAMARLLLTIRKERRKKTYTANVPALTGNALTSVGPMPLQNPLAPSARQV